MSSSYVPIESSSCLKAKKKSYNSLNTLFYKVIKFTLLVLFHTDLLARTDHSPGLPKDNNSRREYEEYKEAEPQKDVDEGVLTYR